MNRRAFFAGTLSLFTGPLAARAQPALKTVPRLGIIGNADPIMAASSLDAFRQGLRDRGWVENQTLRIEYRWAEGDLDRYPALVAELVRLNVDVIVLAGPLALRAAQHATTIIPIVVAALLVDPVGAGFVASLSRPGGNITGLASQYEEIVTKQVELLAEAVPRLSRLMILRHPSSGSVTAEAAAVASHMLGLKARVLDVANVADFDSAFKTARDDHTQALLVLPNPVFSAHRYLLIKLAASYRLPAFYEFREYVLDGGLMSYGPSIPDMYRRAASYVDRILKGARPGDLPMERPTKFELVINLKTAKALGLTIPPSVLARADEVIQ